MAGTPNDALNWTGQFLGRRDNAGAFMWGATGHREYTGSAWCGDTVFGALTLGAKIDLSKTPFTFASLIYVPSAVSVARAHGLWRPSIQALPGDLVIYDWLNGGRRDGLGDHIAMVKQNNHSNTNYMDVSREGNTADANGNGPRGVFDRRRYRVDILGSINMQHFYGKSPVTPPKSVTHAAAKDEWTAGPKVGKAMQDHFKSAGAHDGYFDSQDAANKKFFPNFTCIRWTSNRSAIHPSPGVKAWQKLVGAKADGYLGQDTAKATQRWAGMTGKDVDGYLGSKSVAAICKKLGVK